MTHSVLYSKLDWCDPGVRKCQLKTSCVVTVADVWLRLWSWCLVEILKMKFYSRFVFELVIWPQQITLARWTQPSCPLCLWQCFETASFFPRLFLLFLLNLWAPSKIVSSFTSLFVCSVGRRIIGKRTINDSRPTLLCRKLSNIIDFLINLFLFFVLFCLIENYWVIENVITMISCFDELLDVFY